MPDHLYFFKHGKRIKIGVSRNVKRRLLDVSAHLPSAAKCLFYLEASYALEKHIHGLLSRHRLQGEWFRDCDEVRSVIERLQSHGVSAFSFEEPARRKAYAPPPTTKEEVLRRRSAMIELLWPDDPVGGFAEFCETPVEIVQLWLDGSQEMPRVVRWALGARVVFFASGGQIENIEQ